ncbi:hypothetical protein ACP70R_041700 [Stipagrostis hirtigluma subsp. patula]
MEPIPDGHYPRPPCLLDGTRLQAEEDGVGFSLSPPAREPQVRRLVRAGEARGFLQGRGLALPPEQDDAGAAEAGVHGVLMRQLLAQGQETKTPPSASSSGAEASAAAMEFFPDGHRRVDLAAADEDVVRVSLQPRHASPTARGRSAVSSATAPRTPSAWAFPPAGTSGSLRIRSQQEATLTKNRATGTTTSCCGISLTAVGHVSGTAMAS